MQVNESERDKKPAAGPENFGANALLQSAIDREGKRANCAGHREALSPRIALQRENDPGGGKHPASNHEPSCVRDMRVAVHCFLDVCPRLLSFAFQGIANLESMPDETGTDEENNNGNDFTHKILMSLKVIEGWKRRS